MQSGGARDWDWENAALEHLKTAWEEPWNRYRRLAMDEAQEQVNSLPCVLDMV